MNTIRKLLILFLLLIAVVAVVFFLKPDLIPHSEDIKNTLISAESESETIEQITLTEVAFNETDDEKETEKTTKKQITDKVEKKTTIRDFYSQSNGVVCHALGVINGHNVTNSIEALNKNYSKGYRMFEVDLSLTSDGYLVCSHGWTKKEYIARYMENYDLCLNKEEFPPTLNTFKTFTVGDGYTVITFRELVDWMKKNDDACFLLDIKLCDRNEAKQIAETIVDVCGKEIIDRFVVSARTTDMVKGFTDAYKFPYLHLLYDADDVREKSIYTPSLFVEFCKKYNVSSFSLEVNECTAENIRALSSTGMKSYVYMIQDVYQANNILKTGVDYLISDYLNNDVFETAINKYSAFVTLSDEKSNGIKLEWSFNNTDQTIKSVAVYRKDSKSQDFSLITELSPYDKQYIDNSVKHSELYEYYVEITTADGRKFNSCSEKITCIEIPELLQAVDKGNAVEIKWNRVDGADGYYLRKKIGEKGVYELVRIIDNPDACSYIDKDTYTGETTYYSIRAFKVFDNKRYTGTYSKGILVQ